MEEIEEKRGKKREGERKGGEEGWGQGGREHTQDGNYP